MAAAMKGNAEVVEELLKLGAVPSMKANDGMTALAFAQRSGNARCLELLTDALKDAKQQASKQQS